MVRKREVAASGHQRLHAEILRITFGLVEQTVLWDLLRWYMDGDISHRIRKAYGAHLSVCSMCLVLMQVLLLSLIHI